MIYEGQPDNVEISEAPEIKTAKDMHWCKQCEKELLDDSRERLDLKDVCNDCYPFGNREKEKEQI